MVKIELRNESQTLAGFNCSLANDLPIDNGTFMWLGESEESKPYDAEF